MKVQAALSLNWEPWDAGLDLSTHDAGDLEDRFEPGVLTPLVRGLPTPRVGIPIYNESDLTLLGQGTFGKVFHVARPDGAGFVIKVMNVEDIASLMKGSSVSLAEVAEIIPRLRVELKAMSHIGNHPHIPILIGSHETDARLTIAMQRIVAPPPIERSLIDSELRVLMRQLLKTLDDCHQKGVAHLDVKPANLLFDGSHLTLVDFGEARFFDISSPVIETHFSAGTSAYRPLWSEKHYNPTYVDIFAAGKTCERLSISRTEQLDKFIARCLSGDEPISALLADPWLCD